MSETKYIQAARKGAKGRFRRVGLYKGKLYWTSTPLGLSLRARKKLKLQFVEADAAPIGVALRRQGMQGRRIVIKPKPRDLMKAYMSWALNHEGSWHYLQRRPMDLKRLVAKKLPVWADCSESTTAIYKAAGLPDPNGRGYDGSGYTGTLRAHTPTKRLASLKVGDFIVYGTGTGVHVVVVYQPHPTDPLVFSHGQESGPRLYRHSVQVRAHGSSFTCHGPAGI